VVLFGSLDVPYSAAIIDPNWNRLAGDNRSR
jgi:hypothetical protein